MSVLADFQVSGLFPSVVGGTGTAQKFFPRLLGSTIGAVPLTPSLTSSVGQLVLPGMSVLNGQIFKVKATGDVLAFTGGGTYTVTVSANSALPGATPVYVALASTGAITLASATKTVWGLDITMFGSTNSGQLAGFYDSVTTVAAGTQAAKARSATGLDSILTNATVNFNGLIPTGLSTASGGPGSQSGTAYPFGLVVGVTFSVSLAQNTASLYQFQVICD
jgi:hypothetical protein